MTEEKLRKLQNYFLPKNGKEYIYCFSMSKYVKIFTISVLVFILLFLTVIFISNSITYLYWWLPVFVLCILLLTVISYPIALCINDKDIEVHAILEVVSIKMTSIKSIHKLDRNYAKDYFIPILATCGFLGHNGLYYDILLRRWIKMCSLEKRNLIMIECVGKHFYVISVSENREEIIEQLTEKVREHKQDMQAIIEENWTL